MSIVFCNGGHCDINIGGANIARFQTFLLPVAGAKFIPKNYMQSLQT
jgi:hypothetical protein